MENSDFRTSMQARLQSIPKELRGDDLVAQIQSFLYEWDQKKVEQFLDVVKSHFNLSQDELDKIRVGVAQSLNKDNKEDARYSAKFDNLVDLALQDGSVVYLVKEDDKIVIRNEVRVNEQKLIPPSIEKIPFLIPNAGDVTKAYEEYLSEDEGIDQKLFLDIRNRLETKLRTTGRETL